MWFGGNSRRRLDSPLFIRNRARFAAETIARWQRFHWVSFVSTSRSVVVFAEAYRAHFKTSTSASGLPVVLQDSNILNPILRLLVVEQMATMFLLMYSTRVSRSSQGYRSPIFFLSSHVYMYSVSVWSCRCLNWVMMCSIF